MGPACVMGLLLSPSCIQSALCCWPLQYFPSARRELVSWGLQKVMLISELVGVQSQLCLEATRVPFPLLWDCSVNAQVNLCKLLSRWKNYRALTFLEQIPLEPPWQHGHRRCCLHSGAWSLCLPPRARLGRIIWRGSHSTLPLLCSHKKPNFNFPSVEWSWNPRQE